MEFLVASSPETSSSSSDSYSPSTLSSELGLDPSDPLNMLLHNDDSSSSSQDGGSPPDWSAISALWPDAASLGTNEQQKPFTGELTDFSDIVSFPMDMDFNPSISIDPSALHFNPPLQQSPAIHIPNDFGYPAALAQQLLQQQQHGETLPPTFPFNFSPNAFYDSGSQSDTASETSSTKDSERRLSVGSSASSPSLSSIPPFSPAQSFENIASSPDPTTVAQLLANAAANSANANVLGSTVTSPNETAAQALAERVRQMAGVMLALPMSAQLQALEAQQNGGTPATPTATQAPKLPIPRLPRPTVSTQIKSAASSALSSAASTPPPSTPSAHSPSPLPSAISSAQTSPSSQSALPPAPAGRPKTSHTTIERRYRTNLNARIQSLRMAVPALRVVEDRDNISGTGKKKAPNKVLVSAQLPVTSGSPGSGGTVVNTNGILDIIDERGYVDGVKVARKCSKANVLGKAVEYIKVLKRRELRLRNEQAGLRALISGLVGGPALLREWEREWKNRFGGEEKDEVDPDEQEGDEDEEDAEDDEGDDEEAGRKRKRGKFPPAPSATKAEKKKPVSIAAAASQPAVPDATGFAPVAAPAVPEKRKRGRPRKVVPATSLAVQEEDNKMDIFPTGVPTQQGQGQQYLLAVFAVFSFFNSPLTSSSPFGSSSSAAHAHAHTGHVIAPANQTIPVPIDNGWGLTEFVHMFQLLVSICVLVSFASSWTGLGKNVSISSSLGKLVKVVKGDKKTRKTREEWVDEAEAVILSDKDASAFERAQIYYGLTSPSSTLPAVSDLITAALVLYPPTTSTASGPITHLARMKARSAWSAALKTKGANVYEKMILQSLTVDEASSRVSSLPASTITSLLEGNEDEDQRDGLVEFLAEVLVTEKLRTALGVLFVRTVRETSQEAEDLASSSATIKPGQFDPAYVDPTEQDEANANEDVGEKEMQKDKECLEREWTKLVDASKELGGYVADVGRAFERLWKARAGSTIDGDILATFMNEEDAEEDEESVDAEIKSLLTALVLFRKTFTSCDQEDDTSSSALLSPPPSPGRPVANNKEVREIAILREALGSRIFEVWSSLEDARDKVVDLVVERERRWIGL